MIQHVHAEDRAALFAGLQRVLRPGGVVILSSPHPTYTRRLQRERPDLLHVIDKPVDHEQVLQLATTIGLELRRDETFDVESGRPRYQVFELATPSGAAVRPERRPAYQRRVCARANPLGRELRRARHGARLASCGRVRLGAWFVLGRGPSPGELDVALAERRVQQNRAL